MLKWKDKTLDALNTNALKRNWVAYGVLLCALFAMAFFGVCDPTSSRYGRGHISSLSGDAAKVGNQAISEGEFRRAYSEIYNQYQRQFQEGFDPSVLELARTTINQLVDQRVYYITAEEAGVAVSDAEVEKILTDAEAFKDDSGKFSGERFDDYLRANRYTEKSFMEDLKRRLAIDKYRRFVAETQHVPSAAVEWDYRLADTKLDVEYVKLAPGTVKATVTPADVDAYVADAKNEAAIKEYFDKNPSEFNKPKKVHARHILVSFQGARNAAGDAAKRSKDEAKAKADKLLAEVKGKADFVAVANANTDDPSGKKNGGDLGFFAHGAMVKEFSDEAFGMKEGEISGVVASPFGFHIIKVEKIEDEKKTTLEQAKRSIAEKILARDKAPNLLKESSQKILQALKDGTNADAAAKAAGAEWKATGAFGMDARFIPGLGNDAKLKDAALSLSTSKKFYPEVVDVNGTLYVLRLKSRTDADLSKLDDKRRRELREAERMSDAFEFINSFKNQRKEALEKDGKIKRSESYLALDKTPAASS